jgi:mannosyltransferase OCH1-like enzyme
MVFMDRSVYYYQKPDTDVQFPKIIHQTWKTKELNEEQKSWQKTVLEHYPDYQYILWSDEDMDDFVKKNFADYYETWNSLTPFIKKVDTIRYMWMYLIGGIYFDLDIIVYKNMENLLLDKPGSAFIPVMHSIPNWKYDTDAASPAILASYPKNPIWLYMLEQIKRDKDRDVLSSTGPIALANLLRSLPVKNNNLVFLSEPRCGISGLKFLAKYSKHINTGTWA